MPAGSPFSAGKRCHVQHSSSAIQRQSCGRRRPSLKREFETRFRASGTASSIEIAIVNALQTLSYTDIGIERQSGTSMPFDLTRSA